MYKGKDKAIIEDKIDKLLNLNDVEWKKILEKNSESIMKYDKNNLMLRNLVEELLKSKKIIALVPIKSKSVRVKNKISKKLMENPCLKFY